jgi:hypothetical protein
VPGQASLKALARRILQRDSVRDDAGTHTLSNCPTVEAGAGHAAPEDCAQPNLTLAWPDPERAAIMEADGGVCRYWAERLAALHPDRPPPGVSPRRWGDALDAALRLVERWGPQLAAFNWTECDLFGALPAAPAHAIDCQGAAWLLHGTHRVVAVTPDALTVRTPSGAVQRIRRRALAGAVPLWELVE